MVLAIRKKPLYQMAFMIFNTPSGSLAGKGAAIMLGFEEGLETPYDGITDLPGVDILFASTMLYYGLPLYLAVNVVDKGIGAIEFGSSLMSEKSKEERMSDRKPESEAGRAV